MQTFITAVAIALIVSFLCSIFESVLLSLNTAQVEALATRGQRAGSLLRRFKQSIDAPIAAILIVNTIAHTIGAAVAGASYEDAFDSGTLWIFTIVFTIAVLLFTEIIPKTLGVTHAPRLATPVAYGIQILIVLLRPLIWVTERISSSLRGNASDPVTSVEEIRLLAALGRTAGVVGPRTAGMILGATELREVVAADVMLPRQKVAFLSTQSDTEEIFDKLRNTTHSRFPVTPTRALDQVSGIVLAKDLLLDSKDHPDRPIDWASLVREPLIVPEFQPLNVLLRTFQESRSHMAIVVDEYGHVLGIATLEDVLEEIVGDIIDESDPDHDDVSRLADGRLELSGGVGLRKVCTILDLEWDPNERSHSLNGIVVGRLGRLPCAGDVIHWRGHKIEVLSATDRRAERLSISKSGTRPH